MRALGFVMRLLIVLIAVGGVLWYLAKRAPYPEVYEYGVSFNTLYANELGLDWEEVYTALLEELQVKHLRLAAHWPMVEPESDAWNFEELDHQIELAEENGADVILAVGRRLPRWPECHVPAWALNLPWGEQRKELRAYLTAVVERYKDSPAVVTWQVENEPFLTVFAYEHCGSLDKKFLDEEIALVRELDPSRPILITDSGNLGTWYGAYRRGDRFGTSVYVYLYNERTGPFRTVLPPEVYVVKRKMMELAFGTKDVLLAELSLEPWLNEPVTTAPIDVQVAQISIERVNEILAYARETRLSRQYLWGAEWWYWLKETQGHPEYWTRMHSLFTDTD